MIHSGWHEVGEEIITKCTSATANRNRRGPGKLNSIARRSRVQFSSLSECPRAPRTELESESY